ncbi:MAG: adenylate/guanylate cyclase domain-containing protein [Betaproteobacteria bacterium]|nr:adenylate/guanylate cyclase domain-containing protein [Betaproteobacteria bacterium]
MALVACALAATLGRTGWLRTLENLYADSWTVLAGERYTPRHTALVVIDDDTLAALKDDPIAFWAPHFARVLDVLEAAGAKVVGFDYLILVSAEGWLKKLDLPDSMASRAYDAPLRAALARGRTVLISQLAELRDGQLELLLPPRDQLVLLPHGIQDLGVANLQADDDKYLRHFTPSVAADPGFPGLGLGLQLALRMVDADPTRSAWDLGGQRVTRAPDWRRIGFAGPPGTIPSVSMTRLLAPKALEDPQVQALKGKAVILAADNSGTPDRHFTPYSHGPQAAQMSGGEVHANIVETLLGAPTPRALPPAIEWGYLLLVALAGSFAFLRLAPGRGALLGLAFAAGLAALAGLTFRLDWLLPVAAPQAALAAAYLMTLGLRLTGEERARARMRGLFERYVSDQVVEKLLSEERRPDLGGETLTVTVLFSDIRNFTTIAEKLSAHEVVEMLNAYFTRACEPILAEGGSVDKFIGDAVMALFGAPAAHPDHARRALRAALAMAEQAQAFREWMRRRFPDRGLPEFAIGVGLHTGEAVIGDIGTPKRSDFTAIGDTVNAASRLEGATKQLACVIAASEATLRAAGAGIRTGKMETLQVKGRAEPIRVFEVTAVGPE